MDSHERARSGADRVLIIVIIIFVACMIGSLVKGISQHVDGDTLTINSNDVDSSTECGDAQAQEAMRRAGVRVPIKCKNTKQKTNAD